MGTRIFLLLTLLLSAACAAPTPENASLEGTPPDRPGKTPKKTKLPLPLPPVPEEQEPEPQTAAPTEQSFEVSATAPASFTFVWQQRSGTPAPDGRELVVAYADAPILWVTSSSAGPSVVASTTRSIAADTTYTTYATIEKDAYSMLLLVVRVRAPNGTLVTEARRPLARNATTARIDVEVPDPSVYRRSVTLE